MICKNKCTIISCLLTAIFFTVAWASISSAASIVLLKAPGEQSQAIKSIEFVSASYGVDIITPLETGEDIQAGLLQSNIKGILVTSNSISAQLTSALVKNILEYEQLKFVPVLFIDLSVESLNHITDYLTEDSISVSTMSGNKNNKFKYKISGKEPFSKELSNQIFQVEIENNEEAYYFNKIAAVETDKIVEIQNIETGEANPVFFKKTIRGREIYFLTKFQIKKNVNIGEKKSLFKDFIVLAPFAMFINKTFGKYCWHSDGVYANFTIDDPWLREPYGNLSYEGILNEMNKTKFHTTIAFVPWNFDRNNLSTVRLFRDNPDKLSVCIHGNNHDHEEFSEDRTGTINENNIKQALARMEEFKKQTGIDYDRVMVFPHKVASNNVISLLRRYDFTGTANLQNRLPDSINTNPINIWSDFVNDENGIPSLKRELPFIDTEDLAILLFLNIPLILHTHHDYFFDDIGKFSKVAKTLNEIQPNLQWVRLEDLFKRLYLKKMENDGSYRVLLFGNRTIIKNTENDKRKFIFQKRIASNSNICEVIVNENKIEFKKSENQIMFEVEIKGMSETATTIKLVDVIYEFPNVSVEKDILMVWVLRYLSDFRDNVIGRTEYGRWIVKAYYSESERWIAIVSIGITAGTIILLILVICYTVYRTVFRK